MEVAYGTRAGKVRVVVRHPENIGQAPQIFQSYSVHTCPIMRVVLGERHLISGQYFMWCPIVYIIIIILLLTSLSQPGHFHPVIAVLLMKFVYTLLV